jgi:hypothetical protein
MCNVKAFTSMNNVKDIILVWNILELMLFCTTMQDLCPKGNANQNTIPFTLCSVDQTISENYIN